MAAAAVAQPQPVAAAPPPAAAAPPPAKPAPTGNEKPKAPPAAPAAAAAPKPAAAAAAAPPPETAAAPTPAKPAEQKPAAAKPAPTGNDKPQTQPAAPAATTAPKPEAASTAKKPAVSSASASKNAENKARMDQLLSLWKDFQQAEQQHTARIGDLEIRLTAAEKTMLRFRKFCGDYQLLWKIKDFRRVYEEATSEARTIIYSPQFDTHRNGYKMQISLCPNGDGKGKGAAMSVFFAICKGTYDAILNWPFGCAVKITLVDQQFIIAGGTGISQDVVRVFTPNPRPENEPFIGRPRENKNMSLGFPRFITLADLFSGGYIREDAIYLKVYVDLSSLCHND